MKLFYCVIILSGQFIFLPQFLSHCNKNLKWWTKGFKTTDKLQLSSSQADRSFIRQTLPRHMGAGRTQRGPLLPLGFPFLYFRFPPFGCPLCKIGLIPRTGQSEGMEMGICSRPVDRSKLYISRLCLCLRTVQPVMIKCI